jgi:hypothetical protein
VKVYGEGKEFRALLKSALGAGRWSNFRPGPITPNTLKIKNFVGLKAALHAEEKRFWAFMEMNLDCPTHSPVTTPGNMKVHVVPQ